MPSADVTVGDGRTVKSQVALAVKIDLGGYCSNHNALIMPLGDKFDAVVGFKFFEDLQSKCQGPISWDFLKQKVSFTIGRRKYTIGAHEVPAHMFLALRSCDAYLRGLLHKSRQGQILPSGTKLIRFSDTPEVIRTNEEDDFLFNNTDPIPTSLRQLTQF
mmetsp:Transcript_7318/g.18621  ORF Transcript_7318/g.18621 Transcript_7318/m.18621 type:complete len:160 (+) Transcript_7318:906-1385(+)|eukprot:CAMPEP_0197589192 /NCGR_PEP_ID=MMETSP1326-20131121/10221_1 /TAXON_ID=1155430 /ORGANISM="Genus nov. species nov., Strain RCC2288" /LENGTH=159 /DNA_ID=CAMNT_0043154105 /DNA_START=1947 /DNA_END=2426 /DNA_ORIENTATION=-